MEKLAALNGSPSLRTHALGNEEHDLGLSCVLPEPTLQECRAICDSALQAIDFNLGVAHVELKVTSEGPKVIEVNARQGGDRIPVLVEQACGLSLVATQLALYLGEHPSLETNHQHGSAVRFVTAPSGLVRRILGADLAMRVPGIIEVELTVQPGDLVRPLQSSADRLGHVIAVADTPYLAGRLADAAVREVQVELD